MSKPTMTQAADAMALALPELAEALEAYEKAKDAASVASRAETEALNKLNARQREAFEELYSVMTPLCLHMTAEMARNCRTCNPQQMQIDRENSE